MKTQTEISWLAEFVDIHEKWRNLNLDRLDMDKVRSLEERLNAIEPQINEFEPEEGNWGNINLKRGVMADIGFMKCFFKRC